MRRHFVLLVGSITIGFAACGGSTDGPANAGAQDDAGAGAGADAGSTDGPGKDAGADAEAPDPPLQPTDVKQMAMGRSHTCALLLSGQVKCWGLGYVGQLGLGDNVTRGDEPGEMGDKLPYVNLGTGRTATLIAAGNQHTCAIRDDGSVVCWGAGDSGELGQGIHTFHYGDEPKQMGDDLKPALIGNGKKAIALAGGFSHTCAVLDDHTVKCWGANYDGRLGQGDKEGRGKDPAMMGDALKPIDLGSGRTAMAVSAGDEHSCALLDDRTVKCWGANYDGQLGQGDTEPRGDDPGEMGDVLKPVEFGASSPVEQVVSGLHHNCVRFQDGRVKCWGSNRAGELGVGDTIDRGDKPGQMGAALPYVDLGTGRAAVAISAGKTHSCALLDDATVKCWGGNSPILGLEKIARLGDDLGEMGDALLPLRLGTGQKVRYFQSNHSVACARLASRELKCWGYGGQGALGLGDKKSRGDFVNEMGDHLPAVKIVGP